MDVFTKNGLLDSSATACRQSNDARDDANAANDGRNGNAMGLVVLHDNRPNLRVLLGLGVGKALVNQSKNANDDESFIMSFRVFKEAQADCVSRVPSFALLMPFHLSMA